MILQRWQTVYMLISVIAMGIAAFFPAMGQLPQGNAIWIQSGKMMVVSSLLCALTAVLLFVAIFKFKNLKFQKQLCSVGQLLIIGYYVVNGIDWYLSPMPAEWNLAALLPAFAFACLLLAKGRIDADYRLLHDSERLR